MASADLARRPKRQAARNKIYTHDNVLRCNPALYVGYVEDLETPEMIMKKFEALQEFQAEQDNAKKENEEMADSSSLKKKKKLDDTGLTEDDLEEIFRRTSAFTAASTVLPPEPRHYIGGYDSESEYYMMDDGWDMAGMVQEEGENGEAYFICDSDDEDDLFGSRHRRSRKNKDAKRKRVSEKVPRAKRSSDISKDDQMMIGPGLTKARQSLMHRIRRRRPTDPDAISFVRIPNDPVPSSWGRRIVQYVPPECTHVHTFWKAQDVLMPRPLAYSDQPAPVSQKVSVIGLDALNKAMMDAAISCEGFNGIVLNPPWKEPRPGAEPTPNGITPEDLLKLPLGDNKFLPAGFVYIWTPKHWLHRTLQALEQMNLHYVENAVVVNERVGGGPPLSQPCTYFSQQKETLLVCRRGTKHPLSGKISWEPIELRHQRISDVYVASFKPSKLRKDVPVKPVNYVHKMVETMLPISRVNLDTPDTKSKFCEVWTESTSRSGWVLLDVAM